MATMFFPIDEYRPATARVVRDGDDAMVNIDTAEGKLSLSLADHPDALSAAEVIARAINGLRKRPADGVAEPRAQALVTAIAMAIVLPFWGCVVARCSGVL